MRLSPLTYLVAIAVLVMCQAGGSGSGSATTTSTSTTTTSATSPMSTTSTTSTDTTTTTVGTTTTTTTTAAATGTPTTTTGTASTTGTTSAATSTTTGTTIATTSMTTTMTTTTAVTRPAATTTVVGAVVATSAAVTVPNASLVSRTITRPLPKGILSQNTFGIDNIRLERPLTYPPATIQLSVVNDLFVLSEECKNAIYVTGPGWLGDQLISSVESVVSATAITTSTTGEDATATSGSFFPTFPDDVPGGPRDSTGSGTSGVVGATASSIRIVFKGTDRFTPSFSTIYNITIPDSCMVSGAAPLNGWAIFFRIFDISTTVKLSMSITFCGYLAAIFSFVAAFMGSITPLLILHVFTVSAMTSCGPTALFQEFSTLKVIFMPIDIAINELPYSVRYLAWTIIVAAVFAAVEGVRLLLIRFGVRIDLSMRDTELDELESGGRRTTTQQDGQKRRLPGRRGGGGPKAGDYSSPSNPHSEALILPEREDDNTSSPQDRSPSSPADDAASVVSEEAKRNAAEDAFEKEASKSTLMIQPPYVFVCFILSAFTGLIANSTVSLFSGVDIPVAATGLAGLCLLLGGLGIPLAAYGFGRRNKFHYCTYTGMLGNLPLWMQPSGVWGPNSLRLRCGALIDDTTEGKRFFTAAVLLYVVVTSIAMGSSPTQDVTCRAVLAICVSATVIMGALLYGLFPLRSRFSNYCTLACLVCLLGFQVSLLTFITTVAADCSYSWSSGGSFDSASSCNATSVVNAQFALGVLTCLGCATLAIGHIVVLFLEVRGRTAYLHVRACKRSQLVSRSVDPKEDEARLRTQIEELCEAIDRHAKVDVDDDGHQEAMVAQRNGASSERGTKAQQARRQRSLEEIKARQEAADRHIRNRGIRAVYEQVRPPRTFTPGDAAHPSMADYLVQDYAQVPEDTRREYRMLAQMRRDRDTQFAIGNRRAGSLSPASFRGDLVDL